ncbi:MAG TPA: Calx-beta domain-containing protein [Aggregatilinea sp.]|uniref:SH3 domain-containing protein n=1 Tax=Aggregatilinea sp. TaxID=2806333 RepID=UPI002C5AA6B0|nr:SH3 domain-containing protein [Aggregatilinea sp.]HML23379.1 Calx-beta domain-containing protein [Aggregatilinea sp.]
MEHCAQGHKLLLGFIVVLFALGGVALPVHHAEAQTTYIVTSDVELAAAINAANSSAGADTIYLHNNFTLYYDPSVPTNWPTITSDVTITTENYPNYGCSSTGICGIGGYDLRQILKVGGGGNLTIDRIFLTDGYSDYWGGAIWNGGGAVTIRNSWISNNAIGTSVTGTHGGGAIYNSGTLIIDNTLFDGNMVLYDGAESGLIRGGGAIYSSGGSVTVSNSTFRNNSANGTGGSTDGYNGGAISTIGGTISVTNCLFQGNSATQEGGAIFLTGLGSSLTVDGSTLATNSAHSGGAILVEIGSATITRSSMIGNSAVNGGGLLTASADATAVIAHSSLISNSATAYAAAVGGPYLSLLNSTILYNSGPSSIYKGNNASPITLAGTIVAHTLGGVNCVATSVFFPITDGGYNVADDASCGFTSPDSKNSGTITLSYSDTDILPALDPGHPYTRRLYTPTAGSDPIGVIPVGTTVSVPGASWTCSNPSTATDQIGGARPQPANTYCDLGAIESAASRSQLTVTRTGTGTGTVTSSPAGISCGATCSGLFAGTVTLTAVPAAHNVFTGWTGCTTVAGNTCTVLMTADRTVQAAFVPALVTVNNTTADFAENASTSFTVALNGAPMANVTVPLTSTTPTVCTVPASVTFTPASWGATTVTITGVDDNIDTPNRTCTVTLGAATSANTDFNGVTPSITTISRTVLDNDTAGVTVAPTTLNLTEGTTGTFNIVLTSQPTGDVAFNITPSNASCSVSTSTLTVTPALWATANAITVTAPDNYLDEPNSVCAVQITTVTGMDPAYNAIDPADVTVNVADNDTADVTVTPTTLNLTEGTTGTFDVVLASQPTSDVTIGFTPDNTSCTLSDATFTFTDLTWNTAQQMTVTATDDTLARPDRVCTVQAVVVTTTDTNYSAIDPADVTVNITEDDVVGVSVAPTALALMEGTTGTFNVVLTSEPTDTVSFDLVPDSAACTVSAASVTFLPGTWSVSQSFTVTAINDDLDTPDRLCTIQTGLTSSLDTTYATLTVPDVAVTVQDNDSAGITVAPTALTVAEAGTGTFQVVLTSQPTADVTINLTPDSAACSVNFPALTFTAFTWNTVQTVTVSGTPDDLVTGVRGCTVQTVATSTDAAYNAMPADDVTVTVTDDDTPGVTITPSALLVGEGQTGTFSAVLTSQPAGDVTVSLTPDSALCSTSTALLTFTAANWNVPQVVTITAPDDTITTGDRLCTIQTIAASPADANYNGLAVDDVAATVVDDDVPGLTFAPNPLTVDEGTNVRISVVMNTQPAANVTIALATNDPTLCAIDTPSLTFTPLTWDQVQTIQVTSLQNSHQGDAQCTIITSPDVTTGDPNYNGLDPANLVITIRDDDGGAASDYVVGPADHARAQAPLCADLDGSTSPIIRADVPAGTVPNGSVYCRIITENGVYRSGEHTGEVGIQSVLELGVIQAVDVFGLQGDIPVPDFTGSINVCLEESGRFLYLDATTAPRVVSELPVWLDGEYTCASVANAGTVVLVQGAPAAIVPASLTEPAVPLSGCMVATRRILNLRTLPDTGSAVLTLVPYNVSLTATQRQGDWFNVDYLGTPGWLNAAYLTLQGTCG